jgi:hypothetical protein
MKLPISSEFQELLEKNMDNSKPEFVYHYTDMDALLGVLENGELWLTDRNYMDDVYDEEYIKDVSDKLLDLPNNGMLKSVISMSYGVTYSPKDSYIFSASTERDVANQWLCYGNGSVCIEFRRNKLEEFIAEFAPEHQWNNFGAYYDDFLAFPVFYDEEIIKKIKDFLQEKYADGSFKNIDENSDVDILEKYVEANYDYHLLYGFTKPRAFSAEKEYRFLVLSNQKPCFRTRNDQLIPFVKVKHNEKRLPITSITIGPKNHDEHTKNALEKLLKSHGYDHVEIRQSSLFLR